MARKQITINLKNGDNQTPNGDLQFEFRDASNSDAVIATANYAAIGSNNNQGTDAANITYTLDNNANNGEGQIILDGVEVGSVADTDLKVAIKDEADNEIVSDAYVSSGGNSSGGGSTTKEIDTYTFDSQSADLTTIMTDNSTFVSVMPNAAVDKMLFMSGSPESLVAMSLGAARTIDSNISSSGSLQGISIPSTVRKASMYDDGTSVIVGNSQGVLIQISMTTAYSQSTASLGTSFNPAQVTDTGGLYVDNATSRIFATEAGGANLFSFTMGDVLDVSTTTYDNKTVDLSTINAGITNITGVRANADLTKLYVMNADEKIYQLSFGTAGDINTLADDNKFLDVASQYNIMLDFWIDGTNLFALGNNKILYKYN